MYYIMQRVERELQIKGAGHLFSGSRNSVVTQQQQQPEDPSEPDTLSPGMLQHRGLLIVSFIFVNSNLGVA